MDYEINELGQIKRGYRGLQCWSCGGTDHLWKDCKLGHDDDDDQLMGMTESWSYAQYSCDRIRCNK